MCMHVQKSYVEYVACHCARRLARIEKQVRPILVEGEGLTLVASFPSLKSSFTEVFAGPVGSIGRLLSNGVNGALLRSLAEPT